MRAHFKPTCLLQNADSFKSDVKTDCVVDLGADIHFPKSYSLWIRSLHLTDSDVRVQLPARIPIHIQSRAYNVVARVAT